MRIVEYGCRNYKPFKDDASVELRPLTIIFGKNSSGKSALLRLPLLLLQAISARDSSSFPLKAGEVFFGECLRDLIHGKLPHGAVSFNIKLEAEDGMLDLSADVQNMAGDVSQGTQSEYSVISNFDLRSPHPIKLTWVPGHGEIGSYNEAGPGPIVFRGLLPDVTKNPSYEHCQFISSWRERVDGLEKIIEYLGPYRSSIERVYEMGAKIRMGIHGSGAPRRLALNSELQELTADWYQEHMDGWSLSISQNGNAFECNLGRGTVSVNLSDAGQGMQQILPIVVQQLSHHLNDEPFFDLVEQPELHLHTAAQAPLGDLFLSSAMTGRGQIIIETHSENLLLRIRRRIAEGRAHPDLVALYWVEDHPEGKSTLRRIKIDEYGQLDWWRKGIFSEGYDEVRAMRSAARIRKETKVASV